MSILGRVAPLVFLVAAAIQAQQASQAPPRVTRAVRRTTPILLDGKLDEPAWAAAPVTSDFIQSYPKPNAPAPDRTEVRVLYDDDAVYVGVRMFDAHPDSIAAPLARRDVTGIYSDWLHVVFDSYHDRRTAFRFTVNPRGVKKDVLEFNENNEDTNWDAVWDVATSMDSAGWTAEYRIPLSQLRFGDMPPTAERVWGFQVQREIARRNERDTWAPWSPQDGAFVSKFGDVVGFVGLPTPIHAELLPYASSKLTRAPAEPGNPFFHTNATKPSFGADFKMGLPKGLTLTGAINPDFGQVEVDPEVVNLSAYETFFPEKRPFFIEGSGIFGFGQTRTFNNFQFQQYFYSRRIGRPPTRSIGAPFVDAPDATTIDGAAKLSGKLGPWTVGAIDAVTSKETAHYRMAASAPTQTATVEPRSNYFVGRLRRDFRDGQTQVGGMLTATHRDLSDTAFVSLLRDRALFGGVDLEHGWDHGNWYLSGYAAGTQVSGAPSIMAATQQSATHYYQRPDASYLRFDPLRTSLSGGTAELALQQNGAVFSSLSYKTVTPGFEINDLGFQGRSDYHAVNALIGYQSFTAGKYLQNYSTAIYTNEAWNYGGTLIFNGAGSFYNATLNNFWSVNVGGSITASEASDRLTRGGPLGRTPGQANVNANVGTDGRRPVSANVGWFGATEAFGGGRVLNPFVTITVRPTSSVLVTFGPSLTGQVSSSQYVTTVTDALAAATFGHRYLFGELHQTTLSADTRVNWTLTPALSLQLYAQPFISAGHFTAFKELLRPATADYGVYGHGYGTIAYDAKAQTYTLDPDGAGSARSFAFTNPDFNVRSLRGNAVLRWEYRSGSALYVVWQQQRSGETTLGDFDFHRDVRQIFHDPVTNVFLVKLSYWLGR